MYSGIVLDRKTGHYGLVVNQHQVSVQEWVAAGCPGLEKYGVHSINMNTIPAQPAVDTVNASAAPSGNSVEPTPQGKTADNLQAICDAVTALADIQDQHLRTVQGLWEDRTRLDSELSAARSTLAAVGSLVRSQAPMDQVLGVIHQATRP